MRLPIWNAKYSSRVNLNFSFPVSMMGVSWWVVWVVTIEVLILFYFIKEVIKVCVSSKHLSHLVSHFPFVKVLVNGLHDLVFCVYFWSRWFFPSFSWCFFFCFLCFQFTWDKDEVAFPTMQLITWLYTLWWFLLLTLFLQLSYSVIKLFILIYHVHPEIYSMVTYWIWLFAWNL